MNSPRPPFLLAMRYGNVEFFIACSMQEDTRYRSLIHSVKLPEITHKAMVRENNHIVTPEPASSIRSLQQIKIEENISNRRQELRTLWRPIIMSPSEMVWGSEHFPENQLFVQWFSVSQILYVRSKYFWPFQEAWSYSISSHPLIGDIRSIATYKTKLSKLTAMFKILILWNFRSRKLPLINTICCE
jgi:hypothetical protein